MSKKSVALLANRNNVKVMFWFVALVVMILLGGFATGALQRIRMRQLAVSNGFCYGFTSFSSLRMANIISLYALTMHYFAVFTLPIMLPPSFAPFALIKTFSTHSAFFGWTVFVISTPLSCFAFFSLAVFFRALTTTYFTPVGVAILLRTVFTELGKWFDFFAFGTSFGYALLSHFRLQYRRFWLEPVARYALAVGSSYYNGLQGGAKC